MSKPQQPELHRSSKGATDPAAVKSDAGLGTNPGVEGASGPVPEDNMPGHHPEKEQDKPDLP